MPRQAGGRGPEGAQQKLAVCVTCHKGDVLLKQALANDCHGQKACKHVCSTAQHGKGGSYRTEQRTMESIARDIQKCQIC